MEFPKIIILLSLGVPDNFANFESCFELRQYEEDEPPVAAKRKCAAAVLAWPRNILHFEARKIAAKQNSVEYSKDSFNISNLIDIPNNLFA